MKNREPGNRTLTCTGKEIQQLSNNSNGHLFKEKETTKYAIWFREIIKSLKHTLKPMATIYVCSDWKTSIIISSFLEEFFMCRTE